MPCRDFPYMPFLKVIGRTEVVQYSYVPFLFYEVPKG